VLRYKIRNDGRKKRKVTVAGSLYNAAGLRGYDNFGGIQLAGTNLNVYRESDGLKGIFMDSPGLCECDYTYGSMAISAPGESDVTVKEMWRDGGWWDGAHDFWDDFSEDGLLTRCEVPEKRRSKSSPGSLGITRDIEPGREAVFEFYITWHFPNRPKAWGGHMCDCSDCEQETVKNHYATQYEDAWAAAAYLRAGLGMLEGQTRAFTQALYGSTLPGCVTETLANNLTIVRSTTCFHLSDGTFLAWEGCFDHAGCCEGNCTHVWNYAQTVAFLFPELEHSMRRTEFLLETGEDGNMAFRTRRVFNDLKWDMLPAADGQMGCVLRLYRDWKLSGNDYLLSETWEMAAKALDFAFTCWDKDGDFVLESQQHNTYDIEFYGPNSLTNSLFFAALLAGEKMALHMGEADRAKKYRNAYEKGSKKMDSLLFDENLGYYIQVIDDVDKYPYQYGRGCLSDQLIGQTMAHIYGLGHLFPEGNVKSAVSAIYKNNFRRDMSGHHNVQRTYALNDDMGLLLCAWPDGGRPKLPFVYSDEVWPGIEYQVATNLIYDGFIDEALAMVLAVRERHDGIKRNPWNEVECGSYYARSLASWGLLTALSGYRFDIPNREISFNPAIYGDDFSCFFSTAGAWGVYSQRRDGNGALKRQVKVLYGNLEGIKVNGGDCEVIS
jgi:uncharacterized protein (DUF608 family)